MAIGAFQKVSVATRTRHHRGEGTYQWESYLGDNIHPRYHLRLARALKYFLIMLWINGV